MQKQSREVQDGTSENHPQEVSSTSSRAGENTKLEKTQQDHA